MPAIPALHSEGGEQNDMSQNHLGYSHRRYLSRGNGTKAVPEDPGQALGSQHMRIGVLGPN